MKAFIRIIAFLRLKSSPSALCTIMERLSRQINWTNCKYTSLRYKRS